MTSADSSQIDQRFLNNAMASFLQIAAVAVLVYWCFNIVAPFFSILLWGLIISVALYPVHRSLAEKLGGRAKLSVTILALVALAILIVPVWYLAESSIIALKAIADALQSGDVTIPPPNPSVAEWPLIGDKVFEIWSGAASNLQATLNQYSDQLVNVGQGAIKLAGSTAVTVFQFTFSILIAAAFMMNAEGGYSVATQVSNSLVGTRGREFTDLSIVTIRSVTKGVLGVAIIQALAAALGFVVMDIPAAGLWAGIVLVLAIVQLPPLIIMIPIALWVFSVSDGLPATIFLIYSLIVSGSDTFLKPMLLGRGVDVPMLVILIGAIGGAISQGIIGLFVGAVVLALGYQIVTAWMAPDEAFAAVDEAAADDD